MRQRSPSIWQHLRGAFTKVVDWVDSHRVITIVTMTILLLSSGAYIVYRIADNAITGNRIAQQTATLCQSVATVYGTLHKIVQTDTARIGQKGTPGYAYYAAHPAELAKAKEQVAQELVQLTPKKC